MRTFWDNRTLRATLRAGIVAAGLAAAAWGATLGKVVPIAGQASDIALDEARGVLYIANFSGNKIEVMNTSDLTIPRSINVNPFPGSIALSRDGKYLLIAHYGNFRAPVSLDAALTLINLEANTRQVLSLPAAPLGVAFGADGLALVVTTAEIALLDPVSGIIQTIDKHASLASKTLPVSVETTAPVNITESALGVSGDGLRIFGTTEAFGIAYDVPSRTLNVFPTKGAQPPFGPRSVGVNQDGSAFAFAWVLFNGAGGIEAEFSNPTGKFEVGSFAFDSSAGLLYAQIPDAVSPDAPPVLEALDAGSLALRETYALPETLSGKSLVSSNRVMYAISKSGVTVLPVGSLNQERRLRASVEDVVFRGAFCDRRTSVQEFTITDPGGGRTSFSLTPSTSGITVTPSSGVTPATVRVSIDPNVFANQKGTVTAYITISSEDAVNVLPRLRVLIGTPEPSQRGTVYNVPGKLVDVLADPGRDRFYIVRQDQNQVLVFDGSRFNQIARLDTKLAPTQLAITRDGKNLLVAHENAATVSVYDLDTLEAKPSIYFPYGHIPRSIAVAGGSILAAVHNRVVGGLNSAIDRVDLDARIATELPSLGPIENKIPSYTTLVASPNGANIFGFVADGSTFLYDANSDTFPVYRKEFTALSGAYAASSNNQYVIDNNLLNASLVPYRKLEGTSGQTSGFAFTSQGGLRLTTAGSSSPGLLQRVDVTQGAGLVSTRIAESPIVPVAIVVPQTPKPGDPPLPPQPDPNVSPFTRTIAPLSNGSSIILLTHSGFTVLPANFDSAVNKPVVTSVVNTFDPAQPLTGGGPISVLGSNLSTGTASVPQTQNPLPTILAETCVTVNDLVMPLFLVSPTRINGQLPEGVGASGQLIVHTPGGSSDPFNLTRILPTAPTVIQIPSGTGSETIPAIYRAANNLPVTLVNPVHKGDHLIIYVTGLGPTSPTVPPGTTAPSNPPAVVLTLPTVILDGATCPVTLAILEPGRVGVYRVEVDVPKGIQQGLFIPLTISQGGGTASTVYVRVVE